MGALKNFCSSGRGKAIKKSPGAQKAPKIRRSQNFCRREQIQSKPSIKIKKSTHMETKVTKRPPHSKKGGKKAPHDEKQSPPPTPHKEKNILKSYYMEKKQQKGPPITIFLCF